MPKWATHLMPHAPDIGDDMEKRARRILDKERIVERTRRLFKGPLRGRNPDHAHVVADNVTVCSCWMCGNPRRKFKQKTIAEVMADDWRRIEADWSF